MRGSPRGSARRLPLVARLAFFLLFLGLLYFVLSRLLKRLSMTDILMGLVGFDERWRRFTRTAGHVVPQPRVFCDTTLGPLDILVMSYHAPDAAQRFVDLVATGYFTKSVFARVLDAPRPPIVMFGFLSGDEAAQNASELFPPLLAENQEVQAAHHLPPCDPHSNNGSILLKRGSIGVSAGTRAGERTHRPLWIARADVRVSLASEGVNSDLFAGCGGVPTAQIVNTDALDALADMAPIGSGPDLNKMETDPTFRTDFPGSYLRNNYPKIDFIRTCHIRIGNGDPTKASRS